MCGCIPSAVMTHRRPTGLYHAAGADNSALPSGPAVFPGRMCVKETLNEHSNRCASAVAWCR